jgi:hypothetical protein
MDFIDDEDSALAHSRRILDAVPQFTDVIHAVVGGCINFYNIHETTFFNGKAVVTLAAGPVVFVQAVDTLGQESGHSGFTGSSSATEKIGMVHRAQLDLVFEDFDDVLLPQNFFKNFGSVGAI